MAGVQAEDEASAAKHQLTVVVKEAWLPLAIEIEVDLRRTSVGKMQPLLGGHIA